MCADLPSGIESLLRSLARHGAGILSVTRVLYVAGDWDVEVLRRLFGAELDRDNVILSPFHGVREAHLAITSIWHRMLSPPFGMMFDSVTADQAERHWAAVLQTMSLRGREYAVRELRNHIRNRDGGRFEDEALMRLFQAVLEGRMEDRLRLVMHGLSDIFQVVHPAVYGIAGDNWAEAGFDDGTSFKDFMQDRHMINLKDGRQCRMLLNAFDSEGMPVEALAMGRLSQALHGFLGTTTE